jgi:branched-chain amino acid transport system permease protein
VLTTREVLPYGLEWLGSSPWLALFVGLAVTLVVATALGSLSLKLSGHFLPLSTIAWGISLSFLFGTSQTLGGYTGLGGVPPIEVFGQRLETGQQIFYLIWAFLLSVCSRSATCSIRAKAARSAP